DDVSYYVEWGDGLVEEWTEYYESGGEFTVSHTWDDKGTYTIRVKAKDIHDVESDWATLKVNMPKNKTINPFPLRFLEKYPDIFPILQHLLGL
ncbi:unnamed protein product, partial [marine sediment metagenome]